MSCPPGYYPTIYGCQPAFFSLGASPKVCEPSPGLFGLFDAQGACGLFQPATNTGPCQLPDGRQGLLQNGWCNLTGAGVRCNNMDAKGVPCEPGLVARLLAPLSTTNNIPQCICLCPDATLPVPGTEGPAFSLTDKCPGLLPLTEQEPCPAGQIVGANNQCVCPPGQTMNASGQCQCPAGESMDANFVCQCGPGAMRDSHGSCVCPAGFEKNSDGSCSRACPECEKPEPCKACEPPLIWPWIVGTLVLGAFGGYKLGLSEGKKGRR